MAASEQALLRGPVSVGRWDAYVYPAVFLAGSFLLASVAAFYVAFVSALVFIAVSRTRLRVPPIWLPVAIFALWTCLSLAASDEPAAGWPQIKKLFLLSVLVVGYSLIAKLDQAQRLFQAWFSIAALAAGMSLLQFGEKLLEARLAGQDFYLAYIGKRITGFYGHWMTFSEVSMFVFLVLMSYLLFSDHARGPGYRVWRSCAVILAASLAAGFTRSVWLGLGAAGVYLIWHWKRKILWAIPIVLTIGALIMPGAVRQRVESMVDPGSNSARVLMLRAGWRMVRQHPVFGLGPERVAPRFREFLPEPTEELPPGYYAHLHNTYLHYAAERGVPAALAIVWLLAAILRDHSRGLRKLGRADRDEKFVLHGVAACTIAALVVGLFEVNLGDSEVQAVFLFVVAAGYRSLDRIQKRAKGQPAYRTSAL